MVARANKEIENEKHRLHFGGHASLDKHSEDVDKKEKPFSSSPVFHTAAHRHRSLVHCVIDDVLLPPTPIGQDISSLVPYVCYPCYIPLQKRYVDAKNSPFKNGKNKSETFESSESSSQKSPESEVVKPLAVLTMPMGGEDGSISLSGLSTTSSSVSFHYSLYSQTHRKRLVLNQSEEELDWDSDGSEDEVCDKHKIMVINIYRTRLLF
jgi:hypothetical protein